jgi:hypothetical protein
MNDTHLTDWLLDTNLPSIRYLTLRQLLGQSDDDHEVQTCRQEIMTSDLVTTILARQTESGQWADEYSYYTPKYTSTHWSMLQLAELAADGTDSRLRRGVEFVLDTPHPLFKNTLPKRGETPPGYACFWGNVLRYALHCNLVDDPRVQAVIDYLVWDLGVESRCPDNKGLPCAWGSARALWGLAALPESKRTPEIQAAIDHALTFLLDSFQLVKADYPTPGNIHSHWFRLNFPLFYQADILFVLRVLAELNALNRPGAQPALEWLTNRRQANGRWTGASPYRKRTWGVTPDREETNRWVSLYATIILQQVNTNEVD